MYSIYIIISTTIMMICVEAGVITNASDPILETFLSQTNQKLQKIDKLSKIPKKYTDISLSPDEYKKGYENKDKSNTLNKLWIEKNIPRLISDSEKLKKAIQNKVSDTDVLQAESTNINNNIQVVTIGDEVNNQQLNNDSVVEYLELDIYPNIPNDKFILSTKDNHHILDSDDQIPKEQSDNNTDVVFPVEEKYIDNKNESIRNTEEEIITSLDKAETMLDKQNINTNTTVPIKFEDKSVSDDEENDSDEFIFIDDVSEFATEVNFDNFEISADLLIDEPRFKRAVNIIEEENLPTTLSGLQYTGRHKILINDLSYKNINS